MLFITSRRIVGQELARRLPLLGVMASLMIAVQSIVLPPIGYHLNLTVLSGIVLGPALAVISAFIVNLIPATFGHGGVTVVGLNTIVFATEMVLGYYLFHGVRDALGRRLGVGPSAAVAVILSLLASTLLMIGIVAFSATRNIMAKRALEAW